MKAYLLKPRGFFRLGKDIADEVGTDMFPRSDTLFSALAVCVGELFGKDAVCDFIKSERVRISSAMPYVKLENTTKLFVPMRKDAKFPEDPSERKSFKKLKWVDLELFGNLASDSSFLSREDVAVSCKDVVNRCGDFAWNSVGGADGCMESAKLSAVMAKVSADAAKFVKHTSVSAKFLGTDIVQKVTVDRLGGTSDTFFVEQLAFLGSSDVEFGFWLLADFGADTDIERHFEAALELLGDTGIGADRSNGNGHFAVVPLKDVDLPKVEGANAAMLLSLWFPAAGETDALKSDVARWETILRAGWISPGYGFSNMRKPVWMFCEGSILSREVRGNIVDVTPDGTEIGHKIFRSGRALTIPIKT